MRNAIAGCLFGTAVGDALGLPAEGLSRRRQRVMFPDIKGYHFWAGKGMISDDTEHLCMTAQALISSGGQPDLFARDLARRLRKWLLALPAGVGFATLRAIVKLWVGFGPHGSGVFSAGNGPAMRSPIVGVCYGDNCDKLVQMVRISTRITHTDPKAEHGALAVAVAAHMAGRHLHEPSRYLASLEQINGFDARLLALIKKAADSAARQAPTAQFAAGLGLERGVSGYVYHTVPVVLNLWFRHSENFQAAVFEAIRCGGDTDTVAAILGGIVGAAVGKEGIPGHLITDLRLWPLTHVWLETLARKLSQTVSDGKPRSVPQVPFADLLLRNLFFLSVVLLHGFRRLLPPY